MADKPAKQLTTRQELFVEYYLQCWNGTKAAKLAGYSEKSARETASELLAKPNIQSRVRARMAEVAMDSNEVLARLADHARGTMEDFLDPATVTIDLKQAADAGKLHLLKEVEYTIRRDGKDDSETETVRFKLHDAQAALVHIGKHLGLFKEKVELTGKDGKDLPAPIIYLPEITHDDSDS